MYGYDSILGLYSNQKYLNQKLKEKFNEKYVDVVIFTDLLKTDYSKFDYLIINLVNLTVNNEIVKILKNIRCKVLILVPYRVKNNEFEKFNKILDDLLKVNNNLGIILTPEIVGKGVDFNDNYVSHKLIRNSLLSDRMVVGDSFLNVISLSKFVDEIIRENFSFGISGKKLLIQGFYNEPKAFVFKYLKTSSEDVDVKKETGIYSEIIPDLIKQFKPSLKSPILELKREWNTFKPKEVDIEIPKTKKKALTGLIKKISKFIIVVMFVYLTPLFILIFSLGSLFLSIKFLFNNSQVAKQLLNISTLGTNTVVNINFGNTFYIEFSNLILKVNGIAENGIEMVTDINNLSNNVLGDEVYVMEDYTDKISANLDKIYTDINFLQSDIEEQQGVIRNWIDKVLVSQKINTGEIKEKIYSLKKIISRSSDLLGWESPKKYLVLFQNNMELRPTGGFIGSFALITFDKGRMSEMTVSDVYTADGQLKGHVDPPEPIRKYLGEANWYFRDSNWDPDFKISAEKAKWFLDKEIDQKVDGVIAIDLYFIKSLLEITGPINLTDFNKIITADNLYKITQSEVEEKFFPGSIKKASFLTSLSRNLLQDIQNLPEEKYIYFFRELYKNLEEKHIQFYFDDLNSQEAVTDLNYSGKVNLQTDCGIRCFDDGYMLIDANVGVNKSNLFIQRSQELNLTLSKNSINHELFVNYKNSAGQSLGVSGRYKNYARLILPQGVNIKGVRLYQEDGSYSDLEYKIEDFNNRKDIGFYFEVSPEKSNKIQIVWNSPTSKLMEGGEYRIKVWKQSGTDRDPLSIKTNYQDLTLTGDTLSLYNTDLAKDFKIKFFVKP